MKGTPTSTEPVDATGSTSAALTAEERDALKARTREVKAAKRRGGPPSRAEDENAVLAKIAELPEPDRALAERLHAVITASAPDLAPKLWYGMPAYAKAGKIVCFFQGASKFKARYATLGFSDQANLDEGAMWPAAFALTELGPTEEERVRALVQRAVR